MRLGGGACSGGSAQRLVFRQGLSVALGATFSIQPGTRLDFGTSALPPAQPAVLPVEAERLTLGGSASGGRGASRRVPRSPSAPPTAAPSAREVEGLALGVSRNPARGTAQVRFAVAEAGMMRVIVYDALGRERMRAFEGVAAPGRQAVALDVVAWPPGVYVVRLVANGGVQTARLVVTR